MADIYNHETTGYAGVISQVKLPGSENIYLIHDAQAIHSLEDVGLSQALVFKGTKDTVALLLAETDVKIGDVWLVKDSNVEYVWLGTGKGEDLDGDGNKDGWERLGNVHDAASSKHTHTVTSTGSIAAQTISVTGKEASLDTLGKVYLALKQGEASDVHEAVLGTGTTFTATAKPTTTKIKATASAGSATAETTSVATGVNKYNTTKALTDETSVSLDNASTTNSKLVTTTVNSASASDLNVTYVSKKPDYTDGTLPELTMGVTAQGLLTFTWSAGTLATYTKGEYTDSTASKVTTSEKTVATGSLSTTGNGASVATGLNSAIGVSLTKKTTDAVNSIELNSTDVLSGKITVTNPTITISDAGTQESGYSVVTAVDNPDITVTKSEVSALTSYTAPGYRLENDSTATGNIAVVNNVTLTNSNVTYSGTLKQQDITVSGTTSAPEK